VANVEAEPKMTKFKEYQGGKIKVDAPLGMPIAFYRKSSAFAPLFETLSIKKGE